MTTDTDTDEPHDEAQQNSATYGYVTVVRTLNDDPVNDIDAGTEFLELGKMEEAESYDVSEPDEDVAMHTVEQEVADIIQLPERMDKARALSWIRSAVDEYGREALVIGEVPGQ
jgi:hypothetical protein